MIKENVHYNLGADFTGLSAKLSYFWLSGNNWLSPVKPDVS